MIVKMVMVFWNWLKYIFRRRYGKKHTSLPPCDEALLNNGKTIAVLMDVDSCVMEAWVVQLAKESGQKVDWHFVGGRAVVLATGDLKKVDKYAYSLCKHSYDKGKTFKLETINQDGALRGFAGAKSWYGYYPGGKNHWSNNIKI